MTPREQQKAIARIEAAVGRMFDCETRSYSGRCMFGEECIGVTTDEPELLVRLAKVPGHRMDSMGRSTIVYWPSIPYSDPNDDADDDDSTTQEAKS